MPKIDDRQIVCSFCGKPQSSNTRVVSGEGAYICEDCINKWLEETIAKLDECPFCGGEATIQDNCFGFPHWVYCTECGAKIHGGLKESEEASVMASIEAWNRRV